MFTDAEAAKYFVGLFSFAGERLPHGLHSQMPVSKGDFFRLSPAHMRAVRLRRFALASASPRHCYGTATFSRSAFFGKNRRAKFRPRPAKTSKKFPAPTLDFRPNSKAKSPHQGRPQKSRRFFW
jgi:hypothetical protein